MCLCGPCGSVVRAVRAATWPDPLITYGPCGPCGSHHVWSVWSVWLSSPAVSPLQVSDSTATETTLKRKQKFDAVSGGTTGESQVAYTRRVHVVYTRVHTVTHRYTCTRVHFVYSLIHSLIVSASGNRVSLRLRSSSRCLLFPPGGAHVLPRVVLQAKLQKRAERFKVVQ